MQVGELFVALGLDKRNFDRGLDQAERETEGFGAFFKRTLKDALSFAGGMAIWDLLKAGIRGVSAATIDMNADMEQSRVAFASMLGSAEAARDMLVELEQLAARTPFEFPEVRDAARRFLALGFAAQDVVPAVRTVGDAVAAMGGSKEMIDGVVMALGQIKTKGVAQAEELLQLAERGIPVYQILQEQLGLTADQVRDIGKAGLDANLVVTAILAGLEQRFGGAAEKQSRTWSGVWSTIRDNAKMALREGFEPAFNFLRDRALPVVADLAERVREGVKQNGLRGAIEAIVPEPVLQRIKQAKDFISDVRSLIEQGDWEGAGRRVGEAIAGGIIALKDFGVRIGGALLEAVKAVDWVSLGKAAVPAAFGFVAGFVDNLIPGFIEFLIEHWDVALSVAFGIIFAPTTLIGKIAPLLGRIPLVGTLLKWLVETIHTVGQQALAPIGRVFTDMGEFFMGGLLKGLGQRGAALLPGLRGLIDDALTALKDFGATWWLRGAYFMENLGKGIGSWLGKLRNGAVEVVNDAVEGVVQLFPAMRQKGIDLVLGLWAGIMSLGAWLKDKIVAWVKEHVPEPIAKALGIASPSTVAAEQGQAVAEGLAQGVWAGRLQVTQAAQGLAQTVRDGVKSAVETVQFHVSNLDKLWELWKAGFRGAADSTTYLTKELEFYQQKQALVSQQLDLVRQQHEQMAAVKGKDAEETRKLALEILDLQVQQANLGKSIEETTKKLQEQARQWSVVNGQVFRTWTNESGARIVEPIRGGGGGGSRSGPVDPDIAERARQISRDFNVDLGTAEELAKTEQRGIDISNQIPHFDRGGVFRAPFGRREGLAMLHDRELVIPDSVGLAGAGAFGRGFNITLNVFGSVGVKDIAEQLVREIRMRTGLRGI